MPTPFKKDEEKEEVDETQQKKTVAEPETTEKPEKEQPEQGEGDTEKENAEPVDWETKYHNLMKEARKWEKRAKENISATGNEPEQSQEEQGAKEEDLQKQLDDAMAKVTALQQEKERLTWAKEVSTETGVPEDVLEIINANSRDELAEKAAFLVEKYGKQQEEEKTQSVPVVIGDGRHAKYPEDNKTNDPIRQIVTRH